MGEYQALVPFFQRLLAEHGGDLPGFYAAVAELAELPAEARPIVVSAVGGGG
jgi:predicted aminopeptidase